MSPTFTAREAGLLDFRGILLFYESMIGEGVRNPPPPGGFLKTVGAANVGNQQAKSALSDTLQLHFHKKSGAITPLFQLGETRVSFLFLSGGFGNRWARRTLELETKIVTF